MSEYRATIEEPFADAGPIAPILGESPAYMTLDAQYGLVDDDLAIGSTTQEQTVEQEFQAYVTALLSSPNIDILKFWEVSKRTSIFDRYLIMIPDDCFSHSFCYGDGSSPNSSVGCPL